MFDRDDETKLICVCVYVVIDNVNNNRNVETVSCLINIVWAMNWLWVTHNTIWWWFQLIENCLVAVYLAQDTCPIRYGRLSSQTEREWAMIIMMKIKLKTQRHYQIPYSRLLLTVWKEQHLKPFNWYKLLSIQNIHANWNHHKMWYQWIGMKPSKQRME